MSSQLIITFAILGIAVLLFLSEKLRADLIALLVVVALGVTGILTAQEAFSGFSRSAVIIIMSIFVLAEGLQRTGVTEQAGNLLLRIAGSREKWLTIISMVGGAFLSLLMNNIAAASVLVPAVTSAGRKVNISPSRLLMPLAFATILGGMATLFTSANIVVSSLLRDQELEGFGILDFAPVGLPIVVAGILYMAVWGYRRLPARLPPIQSSDQQNNGDLLDIYQLDERLFRARVPPSSYLLGKSLATSTFREKYFLNVVAIERDGRLFHSPPPEFVFQQGDIVILEGKLEEFRQRDVEPYLEILAPRKWRERDFESPAIVVAEVMVSPRSALIGQTLRQTHFRDKYGMNVLAIWREGRAIRTGLTDLPIEFGDALLLQGPRSRLVVLHDESDLIVLSDEEETTIPVPGKGWVAIGITVLTLLLAALFPALVGEIMLGGALMMILSGVLNMDQVYRAIDWKSIFLIAGMLPMGIAMVKTGAAALLANGLTTLLGPSGPVALLAGLLVLTTLLCQAMNGAAVAAVMTPIAIQAGQQMGAEPRSLAMGVALATSMAFMTPLGHPVNVLVMGAGGYRFGDYMKVGLPLTLLLFIVIMLLLPVLWPLTT